MSLYELWLAFRTAFDQESAGKATPKLAPEAGDAMLCSLNSFRTHNLVGI